jgi:hypothetical protein
MARSVCTHRGSQCEYVDVGGLIYLLNGQQGKHAGDGTWFAGFGEFRVSEVSCREIRTTKATCS